MEKFLLQQLDRLGSGWKSTTAICLYLALNLAVQFGYVSPELANNLRPWIETLFGLGMLQKVSKLGGSTTA